MPYVKSILTNLHLNSLFVIGGAHEDLSYSLHIRISVVADFFLQCLISSLIEKFIANVRKDKSC
jgi:hypothetical protein